LEFEFPTGYNIRLPANQVGVRLEDLVNANWIQSLISMAPPQAGGAGGEGNPYSGLIMLAIMFAIFYFLLIRPQQKKAKEHAAMIDNLQKGATVLTSGGIIGKITGITDKDITLQVADNVKLKFIKSAIQDVISQDGEDVKKGD
jgi:preprotein translocase subunit YajC